jgi:hypothetical protein
MDIFDIFTVIYWLLLIGFSTWFLVYLFMLSKKGCKCALTWHRQALITLIFIAVGSQVILKLLPQFSVVINILIAPLTMTFIVISLVYIFKLKKLKCHCSEDPARTTIEVLDWIVISFTAFALLVSVPILLGNKLILEKFST